MPPSSALKQLRLTNFRAFEDFSISFREGAYLVGANSAGKSTILTALRTAAVLLRQAHRRGPDRNASDRGIGVRAFPLSLREFPALSDSLRHEFGSAEARLELTWKSGAKLTAVWPELPEYDETGDDEEDEIGPFFYLTGSGGLPVLTTAAAKAQFPDLGVIPSLAPVEHLEELLSPKYVLANLNTRLSSRHFRNQLGLLDKDEFAAFVAWSEPWLGGIKIDSLEQELTSKGIVLHLFIGESDSRIPKELVWIGDGVQIWLQLLFHLYRLRGSPTVLLDEPEVYLHPDLQRKLVLLLESLESQIVIATHSSEMLVESDGRLAVLIDKNRRTARRPGSEAEYQAISAALGSAFNLRLARALRSQVALFVEGTDMKVLKRFCITLGLKRLAAEDGVTIIPLNGYSQWSKIEPFAWLSTGLLPDALEMYVILDRDYRTEATCDAVEKQFEGIKVGAHIWRRKELESYLLTVPVMSRLSGASPTYISATLDRMTAEMENEVFSRLFQDYLAVNVSGSNHAVTATSQFKSEFDLAWTDPSFRLRTSPPKQILSKLNTQLQADGFKPLSTTGLARAHRRSEISDEMTSVLERIEALILSSGR